MKKHLFTSLLFILFSFTLTAQTQLSKQPAQAEITDITLVPGSTVDNTEYFASSKDGFVIKWHADGMGEHFQISQFGISQITISPDGKFIAICETDGGSNYTVSAWDWNSLTKVFSKKYSGTVNTIKFSAQGTYLIIGTSTIDNIEFVETKNWQIKPNVIISGMMPNYIYTSDSEKTALFYAQTGNLSYYNMKDGKLKTKKTIQKALTQTILYNNGYYFAGIVDNKIYVYNSTDGKLLKEISCVSPYLVTNTNDEHLTYIDTDAKGNRYLKIAESTEVKDKKDPKKMVKSVGTPRNLKTIKAPKGFSEISTVLKTENELYIGTKSGLIYKTNYKTEDSIISLGETSVSSFDNIIDVTKYNDNFYFLTDNALYKSQYKGEVPEKIFTSNNYSNVIIIDDNHAIFYNTNSKGTISQTNLTSKAKTALFTSKGIIQSIKYFDFGTNKYLAVIENGDSVYIYDYNKKSYKLKYRGSNLNDLVITNDNVMYVSKSASTTPKTPLIKVDLKTNETTATPVAGNISYELTTDGKLVYGISILKQNENTNTFVFCYDPEVRKAYNVLKFDDEDPLAFVKYDNDVLYSNIGKNLIYCYNKYNNSRYTFERGTSIPSKMEQIGFEVCILNNDGSISWIDEGKNIVSSTMYITLDSTWEVFKQ